MSATPTFIHAGTYHQLSAGGDNTIHTREKGKVNTRERTPDAGEP